jgi:hypothetical protein
LSRDHFNRESKRGAGAAQELLAVLGDTQRVGADGAHAVRVKAAQSLAEAGEAGQRAILRFIVKLFVLAEARAEAHRFAQRVERKELIAGDAGDLAMKGIRAQIDGGNGGLLCHFSVFPAGWPADFSALLTRFD